MKFTDLLRKLGIMRTGFKSGTYTNAKDMPTEFLMDDVYDAEKDLVHKEEVKAAAAATQKAGGRKAFFWIFLIIGVLFLAVFLLGSGASAWFFLDLILWAAFLIMAGRFAYQGRHSYLSMSILAVVTFFLSLLFLGAAGPR